MGLLWTWQTIFEWSHSFYIMLVLDFLKECGSKFFIITRNKGYNDRIHQHKLIRLYKPRNTDGKTLSVGVDYTTRKSFFRYNFGASFIQKMARNFKGLYRRRVSVGIGFGTQFTSKRWTLNLKGLHQQNISYGIGFGIYFTVKK